MRHPACDDTHSVALSLSFKRPLLGMTLPELEAVVKEAGLRPFAAKQMARRLYVGRAKNIDEMTELPKSARQWLAERYTIGRSAPKLESRSADGTVKYLFATRGEGVDYLTHGEGGRDVEAVYIPDKDRATYLYCYSIIIFNDKCSSYI